MSKRILLIDDEELVVKSVSKLLTKQGFEAIVCRSGEEGIEKIKKDTVDLIICDIRMPSISGIETVKEIRRLLEADGKRKVPEILITGYADDDATKEAEALQVAEYIYKPFDLVEFLDCVRRNIKD